MAGISERRVQMETNGLSMLISQLAYVNISDWWQIKRARQPYVKMFFVEKGKGTAELHYRDKQVFLKEGNIYIVPSNLEHGYSCKGSFHKLFCHFSLFRYDHYDMFSSVKDIIVLEDKNETVAEAIRCYNDRNIMDCLRLKILIYEAAFEALEKAGASYGNAIKYSPTVYQTIKIINQKCRIDLKATDIAEELFISPATLQKQFKREVGTPLGQYIKDWVMTSAEFDLRSTDTSVKDLAEKYGFCDQFYFSRVFGAYFDISPLKYRNTYGADRNDII